MLSHSQKYAKLSWNEALFYFTVYALPIKPEDLLCHTCCQGKVGELQIYVWLTLLEVIAAVIEFIGHSLVHSLHMP